MISRKFRLGSLDTRWLLKKGDQFTSNLFIIRYLKFPTQPSKTTKNKTGQLKFTVIISTKISKKAVERNKIKRRIYEAIRLNLKDIEQEVENKAETWKVALIPKKRIIDIEYQKVEEDIKKMLNYLSHAS